MTFIIGKSIEKSLINKTELDRIHQLLIAAVYS